MTRQIIKILAAGLEVALLLLAAIGECEGEE